MRRNFTVNTPLSTTLLLLVVFLASSATSQTISVDPDLIDFGKMQQHETQTATVTVSNTGTETLELTEVIADCGCTVPTLETKSLAPGKSTTMEIQFNSKNFNGHIVKMVTILSNDPRTPRQEVMIAAKVLAAMEIEPKGRRLTFKSSPKGEVQMMPITFTSMGPDPLKISTPAKSRKGIFHLKAVNGVNGNPLVSVVEVTIPKDAPVGRHQDMARIVTNVPSMDKLDFYFNSNVQSELNLDIAAIKFRFAKEFDQTITISSANDGTKFKVTRVEIDLPEISVTYDNRKGKEAQIHLKGKGIDKTDPRAIKAKGRLKGTLLIHTNLKSTPTIEVPVSYMLRM